jgi:organic radical activating enzyme
MQPASASVSEIFASVQGEGMHVGRRHLFVRFAGCPMRCRYCDTPESLVPVDHCRLTRADGATERHANPLSVDLLDALVSERARSEARLHALALTGGEPLSQTDFLVAWLPARRVQVPVLLETAATMPAQLRRVLPWVDIVSADIKLPSATGEREHWAQHQACLRLAAGRDVYVKMVVDEDTDPGEVETGARLVAEIDADIPVFLQPATGPADDEVRIGAATLGRLYERAARAGVEVRVVPQIHKMLGLQ